MKKHLLTIIAVLLIGASSFAQTPQSFNYQAVLRDGSGQVIANQEVEIGVAILQGSATGVEVFSETHSVTTNTFGLANLQIGSVNTTDMQTIDWSAGPYFIQISVDGTVMGTSELLSVPFALHAITAENDMVDDADADPTNELQQLSLNNTELSISDGNTIDLAEILNTADSSSANAIQELSLNNSLLSISNGNTVDLADALQIADTSSTNELQDISLDGTQLSITKGSTVDLSAIQDGTGTDNQTLLFYGGRYLSISNGNYVKFPFLKEEVDGDPTNEYNTSVVLNGSNLEVTDGGGTLVADLSALSDSGTWKVNGNDVYNVNSGNVGIGIANPDYNLTVSNPVSPTIAIGPSGAFNNVESGKLIFSEDVSYSTSCGFEFNHNGNVNELYLIAGCPTPDTLVTFRRSRSTIIKGLIVEQGADSGNPFSVTGNSDFNGDMVIDGNLTVTGTISNSVTEIDPVYTSDSLLLKTAANEWNSSIAKTIDAADTTRWGLDSDSTNELQSLSISNDTIYLSDGGSVKLPAASPVSATISTFGYVYELATIADATVVGGADVPFSNNGPLSGVTHTAGTTTITVPAAGTYKIDYGMSYTAGNGAALAIAVNGTVDASTIIPLLNGSGNISGSVMLTLAAGDVVTIRNNSAVALTLALAPSAGAQFNITFYN